MPPHLVSAEARAMSTTPPERRPYLPPCADSRAGGDWGPWQSSEVRCEPEGQESRSMQKWEYMVVPLRLNELGSDGWEAAGLSLKRGDLVAWPVVLLKRCLG